MPIHRLPLPAAHGIIRAMRRWFFSLMLLLLAFDTGDAAPGFPADVPLSAPILAADTSHGDEIVLYDIASGTERALHFGDGLHRVWGFTTDGCRLLYTLDEGGSTRAYSARLDGSDARALVDYAPAGAGAWSVWDIQPSPAGDRIAFALSEPDPDGVPRSHIAWIGAGGGVPEFYSVSGDEHTPRWSPDGSWLTYVSYETGEFGGATVREADLWMVSADGVTKARLTAFESGSVSMPRPSPDGGLVGFVYSPSANNDQFWMIGATPNAIPTQLSYQQALALDLTWLPDGSAMIASARDVQGIAENRLWRIPLIGSLDSDGSQLALDPALTYADYPRYSPDGQYLALRSEYVLALVRAADGSLVWMDQTRLGNTPPVWSPAGFTGEAGCSA
jgi:Tol biopolymer transport system component